jgi:hypothetical protein
MSGYENAGPPNDIFYLFFIATLTCVKTIETWVKSAFATVCVRSAIAGCFLLFWWGWLGRVALHQVTWSKKLINKSESTLFMILFYGNSLNSARNCIQTVVTAAGVIKNMHMSRHWKAELVTYGIRKQFSSRFAHLRPLNLSFRFYVQFVQKSSAPWPVFENSWLSNHTSVVTMWIIGRKLS